MPADRFLHPRLGHSDKVTLLTDLEFRTWVQYILSADDFGVMRCSAVTLQADNDHLSNRPRKVVQRCLETIIKRGLLLTFEHQGRHYVCQGDWQTFQKIEYPRPTFEPKPPAGILQECEAKTRAHFDKHPGGSAGRAPKDSRQLPENSETASRILSENSRQIADYARRLTAKANGLGLPDGEKESERKPDVADARNKRPSYQSDRFVVFEWQIEELGRMLGKHLYDFDLHAFFDSLSRQSREAGLVIPSDREKRWKWLQSQVEAEAQRRGFPMADAGGYDAEVTALLAKGPSKRP
jgi:hypothetical protein